jgi:uncharacterized membrane protein
MSEKGAQAKSTDEAPYHVDHRLERLMFFSDAVFAIAITLLVIEIKIPHLHNGDLGDAWASLRALIPNFMGYVLSFVVIGRFWMAHHAVMQVPERHVNALMWPNLILLMVVAFMPFATANMAENLVNRGPMIFYNCILLMLSLASARIVMIATATHNARNSISALERASFRGRSLGVALTVLITLVASFYILGGFSQIFLALMPFLQRLLVWVMTHRIPAAKKEALV